MIKLESPLSSNYLVNLSDRFLLFVDELIVYLNKEVLTYGVNLKVSSSIFGGELSNPYRSSYLN